MYLIREHLFGCPYCGETGITQFEMDTHIVQCAYNPINHRCASCTYLGRICIEGTEEDNNIESLCTHEAHVGKTMDPYGENICEHHSPKNMPGKCAHQSVREHYKCQYCGARYYSAAAVLEHSAQCRHNPGRGGRMVCSHCGLTGTAADLAEHAGVCVEDPANKRCQTCKHFDLSSSREATCLAPAGPQRMPDLIAVCRAWQSRITSRAK